MACNVVYSTAMRTLMHIGRLRKGEVCMHSYAIPISKAARALLPSFRKSMLILMY